MSEEIYATILSEAETIFFSISSIIVLKLQEKIKNPGYTTNKIADIHKNDFCNYIVSVIYYTEYCFKTPIHFFL